MRSPFDRFDHPDPHPGHRPDRHHGHRHDRPHLAVPFPGREQMSMFQDQPLGENPVRIFIQDNYRYIIATGLPDHAIGTFSNGIKPQNYYFQMPANPQIAEQITKLCRHPFGVAINGVVFDPEAAEFWNRDRNSGWQYEALSGKINFGLDANNGHVRTNGAYHYHGLPVGLIANLDNRNLDNREQMLLIGYAADGFPVYAQARGSDFKPSDRAVRQMRSSYRLKQGQRPNGPGGQYDGTFVQDYEYSAGAGDLDECNGCFGVTPEYHEGIYHYYITPEFPFIARCLRGRPDPINPAIIEIAFCLLHRQ
jgi:hypothetical protein